MNTHTNVRPLEVAIIGAGFSGLCMGIRLKQAGIDGFAIFEKSNDVGGVWRANTYPGACCDIPANLYSFSFELKTDWSRRYPPQPEIQQYMRDCARKYGLYPHLRFNTEIAGAHFDEAEALWHVTMKGGETITARALVSGVGQLGRPAYPKVPGVGNFTGKVFHSADWDHDYEIAGKRIAVIGTGASAIQFIPQIAKQAAQVTVFQRTPPYVSPKPDRAYDAFHRFLFRYVPGFQRLYRAFWYRFGELSCGIFNNGNHLAALYRWITLAYMRWHVRDPEQRRKLTPDYPIGCKRVLFSDNYFEAMARPNVRVVTDGVAAVAADAVRTERGDLVPVDAIIYGTGFKATEFLAPMQVIGRDGRDLNEAWRDGAEAYLGITVSGFPNFFMLYGPNTNLGSNSIVFMIECQAGYIMACLKAMRARKLKALDVRADVLRKFNEDIQARLKNSVWSAGCHSWYHNAAGKVTNNWPGYTREYRRLTANLDLSDFELHPAAATG